MVSAHRRNLSMPLENSNYSKKLSTHFHTRVLFIIYSFSLMSATSKHFLCASVSACGLIFSTDLSIVHCLFQNTCSNTKHSFLHNFGTNSSVLVYLYIYASLIFVVAVTYILRHFFSFFIFCRAIVCELRY